MTTQPTTTTKKPMRDATPEILHMIEDAKQILEDFKRMNKQMDELLAELEAMFPPENDD